MAKQKAAKSSVKASKEAKKAHRKQLELSITDKFLEAIRSLGHDAGAITKEVKKASKLVAKKASEKFTDIKGAVEHKFDSGTAEVPKAKIKRAVRAVQKVEEKAGNSVGKTVTQAKRTIKTVAASADSLKSAADKALEKLEPAAKATAARAGKAATPKSTVTRKRTPAAPKTATPSPATPSSASPATDPAT